MGMQTSKWSKLSGAGLFGLFAALNACGDSGSSTAQPASDQSVVTLAASLENPVLKCEQDQAACLGAAKDPAAALACNDSLRTCLTDAAKQGEQTLTDLEQCREKAAECVAKAGPTGVSTCRSEYETCVDGVTGTSSEPTAGAPATPGIPQLPGAGRRAPRLPIGGGRAFPGLPNPFAGAPGGAFPRLPFAGTPAFPQAGRVSLPGRPGAGSEAGKCFTDLRACVRTPGKDPNQCAADARKCLQDGAAGPEGAGGAGGSGG